jgi:DNA-binding MarR family transcriptional regulator
VNKLAAHLAANELHESLRSFIGQFVRHFIHFMRQEGLSMPQVYVLMHLYHEGECQVSDIGTLMASSNAAASQLVERMVQQELVERIEDVHDRRVKRIRLSAPGEALFRKGIGASQILHRVAANLDPEQRETIHTALTYLIEAMQAAHPPTSSGNHSLREDS